MTLTESRLAQLSTINRQQNRPKQILVAVFYSGGITIMTDPNLPKNGPDQPAPPYGTPEYAEWWQRNFGGDGQKLPSPPPLVNSPAPKKKRHPVLASLAGVLGLIVAVSIIVSVATGGNAGKKVAAQKHATTHASMIPCVNSASMCRPDRPDRPERHRRSGLRRSDGGSDHGCADGADVRWDRGDAELHQQ